MGDLNRSFVITTIKSQRPSMFCPEYFKRIHTTTWWLGLEKASLFRFELVFISL